jgi:hypothetical protein
MEFQNFPCLFPIHPNQFFTLSPIFFSGFFIDVEDFFLTSSPQISAAIFLLLAFKKMLFLAKSIEFLGSFFFGIFLVQEHVVATAGS